MRTPVTGRPAGSRRLRLAATLLCLGSGLAFTPTPCTSAAECRGSDCKGHQCAGKGCGGKACCPHCPVRPAEFGFYSTRWRRWPSIPQPAPGQPVAPLPAVPPASVVPRVDEESSRGNPDVPESTRLPDPRTVPLPTAPDGAAPDRSGAGPTSDQRRAAIIAEATAARSTPADQQEAFARRLVAAVVAEDDPAIRSLIVETAGGLQAPSAIAICRGAVADPDARVRMAACNAWIRRGGDDALHVLCERYREDGDLGVRLRALRALGELKNTEAIPVVVTALDDPDPAVQARAVQVLRQLTGRNLGNEPEAWRKWAANPEGKSSWNIAEAFRSLF